MITLIVDGTQCRSLEKAQADSYFEDSKCHLKNNSGVLKTSKTAWSANLIEAKGGACSEIYVVELSDKFGDFIQKLDEVHERTISGVSYYNKGNAFLRETPTSILRACFPNTNAAYGVLVEATVLMTLPVRHHLMLLFDILNKIFHRTALQSPSLPKIKTAIPSQH